MSYTFASRLSHFAPSATIRMAQMARRLKEQGKDIIDLSLGEPDFPVPPPIKKAAIQAIEADYSHYPPLEGYPALRLAVTKKLERDNHLFYRPENILITTGAKQALMNALLCFVETGDEVLLPTPYWNSYADMVSLAGGKPVFLKTCFEDRFQLHAAAIEAAITPKTKLFLFSSPNNPSGIIYDYETLASFAEVFKKYPHIIIISDEIYEHLNYTGAHHSLAAFPELQNRLLIVNGWSKAFAMTGWRLGYLAAPVPVIQNAAKIQSQITSGANSIAQMAGLCALKEPLSAIYKMRAAFQERRDFFVEALGNIPGIEIFKPQGAFYALPRFRSFFGKKTPQGAVISNADTLALYCLEHLGIACVSGTAFGTPECLRFSFTVKKERLKKAAERLHTGLQQLQ